MYWESVERGWEGRKRGGNKPLCHTLLHLLYVTDPPSPLPFVLPSSRHCCILSHRDYSYAFILFSTFSIPFFSVTLDERMPSLKKKAWPLPVFPGSSLDLDLFICVHGAQIFMCLLCIAQQPVMSTGNRLPVSMATSTIHSLPNLLSPCPPPHSHSSLQSVGLEGRRQEWLPPWQQITKASEEVDHRERRGD